MQMICEGHPQIVSVSRGMRFIQVFPDILPEPVLVGDTGVDDRGVSLYGSVILDGGLFRMWHIVYPGVSHGGNHYQVACAESDDGLTWRKPSYGVMEHGGSAENHLTDLPFHYCPSVFIDPNAPAEAKYRVSGVHAPDPGAEGKEAGLYGVRRGYYTAHSADGIH